MGGAAAVTAEAAVYARAVSSPGAQGAAPLPGTQGSARTDAPVPTAGTIGTQPFTDHRNPPSYRKLTDAEFARYDFGMAVFNTHFVVAGTPNAGRIDGVGPLFNSSSCDGCHNNGARGRGPTGDGPVPEALIIQLASPKSKNSNDPDGDPVYGRVFNTVALDGVPPEGVVMLRYEARAGHYPDGAAWTLRVPHYTLTQLHYGPVAPTTIVKPRLAPALFGAGLLDAAVAVAGTELQPAQGGDRPAASGSHDSGGPGISHDHVSAATNPGRFGWQATARSVRDQTARAFAREMGLTSADIKSDDCTPAQIACLQQPNGGSPEVSDDLFDAVLSFERWLAVPASPTPHPPSDPGDQTFANLGCAACHQPRLPVTLTDGSGNTSTATIAPYTDLHLHDLGTRLADETAAGKKVTSRWRTAPLWGLGYRMTLERFPTFLHDGRARSAEEAILWHDGEAAGARARFERLSVGERKAFLRWVETL